MGRSLLTSGPEIHHFKTDGEEGEDKGEEDERLVSLLERAASTGGSIDGAVVPVVVLCSEDERGQPQIGEDNVNRQDESAQTSRHEGGKESRQEEDNGHRRDDFPVDGVLCMRPLVDEVGGDAHHDDGAGPLHEAHHQRGRTSDCCRHHDAECDMAISNSSTVVGMGICDGWTGC